MTADFDKIISRRGTDSAKWDTMDRKYGRPEMIHLGVADMDFGCPEAVLQGLREALAPGIIGYTDVGEDFYDSVIDWYQSRYALTIAREEIVFCQQINIALGLCVLAFTQPGDEVILHTPAYPPLAEAIRQNGRTVSESPLKRDGDRYTIDFAQMERLVTKRTRLLVLCSPHNPVGRVWSRAELEALGAFCKRHRLLLFADEIHGDITAAGKNFNSVLGLSAAFDRQVIQASSAAKSFNVPGALCAQLIILDPVIRQKMRQQLARVGIHNPNFFVPTIVKNCYCRSAVWLAEVLAYIDDNDAYTRRFFAARLPGFKVLPREGTYLLWVDYRELGCREAELEQWFIAAAGVSVYPGSVFGAAGRGYFRINIACSRKLLAVAYSRMQAVYQQLTDI